jgi:hypothetical protein
MKWKLLKSLESHIGIAAHASRQRLQRATR